MDSSAYLITVLSSSVLHKTASATLVPASPLATFTLSTVITLIGATLRRPVGMSAAVAGAAAAGLCGASGRPAEGSSLKPEGQTTLSVILRNMMAGTLPNVELRAHSGALKN